MIDILNSNPGDGVMHAICGSVGNSFYNIEFSELSNTDKAIVTDFFMAMPKNVGVVIVNCPSDVEVKYFNNDIVFMEGIEEVDYLTTEHSAIIDSFVGLINSNINL